MKEQRSNFEVVRYSVELQDAWDTLVGDAKNGNFLHCRNYMDYHADRFVDHSLLVRKDGKFIAAFPSNELGAQIVSHGGLTYAGLLIGKETHAGTVVGIFETIGDYFRGLGKEKIIYKAVPSVFHRYPADEDIYALTRVGAYLVRRDLSSVVEIACRPKLSDSRKSTARKASKAGAAVVELAGFTEFHSLLANVLRKFDVKPVHELHELELLKSRFPDQIRVFGTELEGRLLAGTVVYDFGHIVHTQYLASSDEGRQQGALDYLLITLLEKTFSHKRYFSFGISTEENGRVLNSGLIAQKEGFGGRGIVHDFYEWIL